MDPSKKSQEQIQGEFEKTKRMMVSIENFQPPEHDQLTDCPSGEIRGLVFHPDSVLKEISQSVPDDFDQEALDELIAHMATTMYAMGGVGFSAIQMAVPLRIFICDIFANAKPKKGQPPSQLLVVVNPEIGWASDEKIKMTEGCLSFPSVHEILERPAVVGLRGLSRKGKHFALRAGGVLGRIVQHEMDHLDGVTFFDRMGTIQRKMASKSTLKFRRGVQSGTIRITGQQRKAING